MDVEDAILYITDGLRSQSGEKLAQYGYDVFVRKLAYSYLRDQGEQPHYDGPETKHAATVFMNAGWELCKRGLLRPGVRDVDAQPSPDGSGGCGFSLTEFGALWLREPEAQTFIPTEPERFARLLEPHRARFGEGFHQRAQEAMRCYVAHAYVACCAMCGAAAESILLAVAIAKSHDADDVLKTYKSASGRSRLETMIFGKVPERLRRDAGGLSELLKYWRDASAHGTAVEVHGDQAYCSIALLLKYASIIDSQWKEFIGAGV